MNLKLTRHRGDGRQYYPDDPEELWVDSDHIEAVWESMYRYTGRITVEYVRTLVLMHSGYVFHVRETPQEIKRTIEKRAIGRARAGAPG